MKHKENLITLHIQYWKTSAGRDWKTACDLYKTKHYDACLFFCHLTIEKLLKSFVVETIKKAAPYTHDLILLARLAGHTLPAAQEELFSQKQNNSLYGSKKEINTTRSARHRTAL